jgi:hypothetical protein
MKRRVCLAAAVCLASELCQASPAVKDGLYFQAAVTQTEADEYTRYELLDPGTASFKIYYEVSTAGARFYYNPIRKGSAASDEAVYDAPAGNAAALRSGEWSSGTQGPADAGCG